MSNLIVVAFNSAADAFEMRAALAKMQTQYLIEMEDAVVVTHQKIILKRMLTRFTPMR